MDKPWGGKCGRERAIERLFAWSHWVRDGTVLESIPIWGVGVCGVQTYCLTRNGDRYTYLKQCYLSLAIACRLTDSDSTRLLQINQ